MLPTFDNVVIEDDHPTNRITDDEKYDLVENCEDFDNDGDFDEFLNGKLLMLIYLLTFPIICVECLR